MNALTDEEANRARRAHAGSGNMPLDIYGEERHVMDIGTIPVIGPFKPAILRAMRKRSAVGPG